MSSNMERGEASSTGKRPVNAFMRFVAEIKQGLQQSETTHCMTMREVSQLASQMWKDLSEDEKLPYVLQAKKCMEEYNAAPKKGKEKRKTNKASFESRCSPRMLAVLMEGLKENAAKSSAIEAMGFQSFFNMHCSTLPRSFLLGLVDRFDPFTRKMRVGKTETVRINATDVGLVLGIPYKGRRVPTSIDDDVLHPIRDRFSRMSLAALASYLTSVQNVNEDFCRAFLLFLLRTFLCPTTGRPSVDLFPAISVASTSAQYNWSQLVLDKLVRGVTNFKQGRTKTGIAGCVALLMFFYFHKAPCGVLDNIEVESPYMAHWTPRHIQRRIEMENRGENDMDVSPAPASTSFTIPLVRKLAEIVPHLPELERFLRAKEAAATSKEPTPPEVGPTPQDQQLSTPSEHAGVTARTASGRATAGRSKSGKRPTISKNAGAQYEPVSKRLRSFSSPPATEMSPAAAHSERASPRFSPPAPIGDNMEDCSLADDLPYHLSKLSFKTRRTSSRMIMKHAAVPETSIIRPRPNRRSAPIRRVKCSNTTRSPFLRVAGEQRVTLSRLEKEAVKNVFQSELPASSVVVKMPQSFLTKDRILTLHSKQWVSSEVVDAWSEVVNADRSGSVLRYTFASDFSSSVINFMDDQRSDDEIFDFFSRFFDHSNPLIKLEDVQLFCVPICWEHHWFMLCININRGCIDYLDSGRRSVLAELEVFRRHLARVQSCMLMHTTGRDIDFQAYAFQSHPCPKQTNDDDCGVYTLKFMEHWWGKFSVAIFPSELEHYRVQIAARLILHPLNAIQLPVVHAATTGRS